MNWCQPCQLPYSWRPRNCDLFWTSSDSLEQFVNNGNQESWRNIDIQYRYNSLGFRTKEFDQYRDTAVDIALGCSFTEGIGLPEHCTWPSIVEQYCGRPLLNLGLATGSCDTVYRILSNITGLFDIQTVFILWPDPSRFELYQEDNIVPVTSAIAKLEHTWAMTDSMSQQRYYKNRELVHSFGHKIIEFCLDNVFDPDSRGAPDRARDGLHYGLESNRIMAWQYIKRLTAK
jgi:hypothetical protein